MWFILMTLIILTMPSLFIKKFVTYNKSSLYDYTTIFIQYGINSIYIYSFLFLACDEPT